MGLSIPTELRIGHDFGSVRVHRPSSDLTSQAAEISPAYAAAWVRPLDIGASYRGAQLQESVSATTLNEEKLDGQSDSFDDAGNAEPLDADALQTAAVVPGAQTGGTSCDASKGTTVVNVTNNNACTRDCSLSHEEKHSVDIGPCCTKAGAAAAKEEKQEGKDAVQKNFTDWMVKNENFLECRAYAVSITCGEAKHKKLKCPESVYNDKCCGPLARYITSAKMQKQGTCNNAAEKLTDCPFP